VSLETFSDATVSDSLLPAMPYKGFVTMSSGIFGEGSSPYCVGRKRGIRLYYLYRFSMFVEFSVQGYLQSHRDECALLEH